MIPALEGTPGTFEVQPATGGSDWVNLGSSSPIASGYGRARISASWLPRALLVSFSALVILSFLALVAAALWQQREQTLTQAARTTQNLARTLDVHAMRSVHEADLLLSHLVYHVEQERLRHEPLDTDEIRRALAVRTQQATQFSDFALIDAQGRRIASSIDNAQPLDLSDQDFFAVLRDHPNTEFYITKPFFSRTKNVWSLGFSRPIRRPDGGFGGVAFAAIDLGRFQSVYAGLDVGALGRVTLWDGSASHVIIRSPADPSLLGQTFDRGTLFDMVRSDRDKGTFQCASPVDGVERIVSFRRVGDLPLVVSVALAKREVLKNWRKCLHWYSAGALIGSAIFSLLTFVLLRQLDQQQKLLQALRSSEAATSQANKCLQASEQRFRDLADMGSDWYWETDAEHRFTLVSDRIRAFGVDPAGIIGKRRTEIAFDLTTEQAKWSKHIACLERHEPFADFVYRDKIAGRDGRFSSNSGKPLFDEAGRFLGYRGSSRDVTDKIQADAQLRQAAEAAEAANRAKSKFLAGMSHELRTPLNAIIGFSDVIRSGMCEEPAKIREYAGDIHASGRHLLEIINEILELSRVEAGKLELHDEEVDVGEVIGACLRLVAQRAQEGGVALDRLDRRDLPLLRAGGTRLKQVLLNLLSNAVKFTPMGGRVTIDATIGNNGEMVVAVADTGIGMTADEIAIAMQPFRQVDSSLARRFEGTGLGLPLTKAFVELHGGRLVIDSAPGIGTTARAIFPADRVARQPSEPRAVVQLRSGHRM